MRTARLTLLVGMLFFALLSLGNGAAGCTAYAQGSPFCAPSEGQIKQRYSSSHTAIDISLTVSAHKGSPVYAPYPGVVVYVGGDTAAPNVSHIVAIKHDPIPGRSENVLSLLLHMGTASGNVSYITVKVGDRVEAGSQVGYQGDAGVSNGVHVHWATHIFPAGMTFLDHYTSWGNGGCKRTDLWWELFGGGGCGANPNRAVPVNPENYTGALPTSVKPACAKPAPQGYIDRPTPGAQISGVSRIDGWASVSGSSISRVEVLIDGAVRGSAVYGTSRPDAGGNVGWYYDWDTSATSNGSHAIQARAVAANGVSALLSSSANTGSTVAVTVNNLPHTPAAPGGLSAQAGGQGAVGLAWRDNASDEQGYYIYKWICGPSGCDWQRYATLGANTTGFSDQGLTCGVSYYYDVSAYNAAGESARAGWAQYMTSACLPPTPTDLRFSAADPAQISIAWADRADNEQGYYIYKWICGPSGCDWQRYATLGANTTGFSDQAVSCGVSYYYDVSAYNAAGESARAGWILQAPMPCTPMAPGELSVAGVDVAQISIAWADRADNEQGYYIYKWICGPSGCDWQRYATLGANTTSFSDQGLTCGVSYYYDVSAYNAAGESVRAGWVAQATLSCGLQSPRNLRVESADSSRVTLAWDDTANEDGYRIYRWNGVGWPLYASLGPDTTSYTDSDLLCNEGYSYRLTAYDSAGEVFVDGWIDGFTTACTSRPPLAAPTNFHVSSRATHSVTLDWRDNASGEDGYRIYRWNGVGWPLYASLGPGAVSFTDSDLLCNEGYSYQLSVYAGTDEVFVDGWIDGFTTACESSEPTSVERVFLPLLRR